MMTHRKKKPDRTGLDWEEVAAAMADAGLTSHSMIADFLRVDARTVRRWAAGDPMPFAVTMIIALIERADLTAERVTGLVTRYLK